MATKKTNSLCDRFLKPALREAAGEEDKTPPPDRLAHNDRVRFVFRLDALLLLTVLLSLPGFAYLDNYVLLLANGTAGMLYLVSLMGLRLFRHWFVPGVVLWSGLVISQVFGIGQLPIAGATVHNLYTGVVFLVTGFLFSGRKALFLYLFPSLVLAGNLYYYVALPGTTGFPLAPPDTPGSTLYWLCFFPALALALGHFLFSLVSLIRFGRKQQVAWREWSGQLVTRLDRQREERAKKQATRTRLEKQNEYLRESGHRFEALAGTVAGIIFQADKDSQVRYVWKGNLPVGLFSGVKDVGDLAGRRLTEALSPGPAAEEFTRRFHNVVRHGLATRWDMEATPAGQWFEFQVVELLMRGARRQYLVIIRDKQREKEAEQVEARSKARLLQAQEIAQMGDWFLGARETHPVWSRQVNAIHELPAGFQPSLEEAMAFLDEDSRKVMVWAVENARMKGKPFDIQVKLRTAHGATRYSRILGRPERGSKAGPWDIAGVYQDITLQTLLEKKLLQSDRELREAQRIAQIGLWEYFTGENRFVWSEEALLLHGWQPNLPRDPDYFLRYYREDSRKKLFSFLAMGDLEPTGFEEVLYYKGLGENQMIPIRVLGRSRPGHASDRDAPIIKGIFQILEQNEHRPG